MKITPVNTVINVLMFGSFDTIQIICLKELCDFSTLGDKVYISGHRDWLITNINFHDDIRLNRIEIS